MAVGLLMQPATATPLGAGLALFGVLVAQVVALFVALRGYRQQRKSENQRAQSAALKGYLEGMEKLILEEGIRKPLAQRLSHEHSDKDHDDPRLLARAQTLTLLQGCDPNCKRTIVQFLYEASLIKKEQPVVTLSYADLREANVAGVVLRESNLSGTDLSNADLSGTDLSNADLTGAKVTEEQLNSCKSLEGATMPNGQKYEDWLKD